MSPPLNTAEQGRLAKLTALAASSHTPGIQYLVVNASGDVFEFESGFADLARQIPVDADTTMMAYSMSKTITAVAVLQLVEAGLVQLDDPVDRHVERLPYGSSVTLRQLLTHTSGVPNPSPLRWVHPEAGHASFDEDAALETVVRRHPRLAFEPGSRYAYSNIGYWLLGKVVERASGKRLATYVSERILQPLSTPARWLGFEVEDRAHHATGYLEKYSLMNLVKGFVIDRELIGAYSGRWLEIRRHHVNGPAFGGLIGSARGFGTFIQDQLAHRSVLLDATSRQLLYTPQQTVRGVPIAMTLGWHIGDPHGSRFFYKEGGGGGFRCMMRVYPSEGIGSVVMTNATRFDVSRFLDTIDPSCFGGSPPQRWKPRP